MPQLRPRHTARLEIYLAQDTNPESKIGILYPDVEVIKVKSAPTARSQPIPPTAGLATTDLAATATLQPSL